MEILQKYYDQLPDRSEVFDEIQNTLVALKLCRVEKLYPNQEGKPLTPETVFRFQVYLQVVLNRVIELTESLITCVNNSNIASAFILLRALDENVSVIYDAYQRIALLIEKNDFPKVYELIFNLQYGSKQKFHIEKMVTEQSEKGDGVYYTEEKVRKMFTARQILNVMDNLTKTFPKHRERYEHLCEYAHPNYDGLMGLYCEWEDSFTVNISKESLPKKDNLEIIFVSLCLFLQIFIDGYDEIVKRFPVITEMSINDLKANGEDASSYEKE